MRNGMLATVVMGLQGGWFLTSDGFGLEPQLPIVFSLIGSVLLLRHGFTVERWISGARRPAFLRCAIGSIFLVLAAVIGLPNARIDAARRIVSCVGLAIPILYVWLFTRFAFRIAARARSNPP